MNYKINETCIEGYEGDKLVSLLYDIAPYQQGAVKLFYSTEKK